MTVNLTPRDMQRLHGVHPDLVKVIEKAAVTSPIQFFVIEGMRTEGQEEINVQNGKSQTMDSRHLFGLAVDLGITLNGVLTWDVPSYTKLADIMLAAAASLNIPIVWGGSWKTLKDYDHFELNRNFYPDHTTPTKEIT